MRHGYAASSGSLVCCLVRALTKGVDERTDMLDWGQYWQFSLLFSEGLNQGGRRASGRTC